ncbi:MAG: hypothetical protein SH807_06305 [Blastochloris sp.]|nr:hypothetical protein [Blastochloris sp.]
MAAAIADADAGAGAAGIEGAEGFRGSSGGVAPEIQQTTGVEVDLVSVGNAVRIVRPGVVEHQGSRGIVVKHACLVGGSKPDGDLRDSTLCDGACTGKVEGTGADTESVRRSVGGGVGVSQIDVRLVELIPI